MISFVQKTAAMTSLLLLATSLFAAVSAGESISKAGKSPNVYRPSALSPEACEHLSDAECQEMDEMFGRHQERILQEISTTGTLKTLVILMRWKGHESKNLPSPDDYRTLWSAPTGVTDADGANLIPGGSISAWLDQNSYGKFNLDVTVTDWYTTDNTETFYADGRRGVPSGGSGPDLSSAVISVLQQMDDDGFDFSEFDTDFDTFLDSVVVLHSGHAAEQGGTDCYGTEQKNRIQSLARGVDEGLWFASGDFVIQLGGFMIASALRSTCDENIARIGVMTHEFLHLAVRLPDLYDTGTGGLSNGKVGGLAAYDLMASPYGQANKQAYPGSLSPYAKYLVDWVDPLEIQYNGKYSVRASQIYPDIYKISTGYPDGEYLLIENRQPIFADEFLWGNGGILIYHIDENVSGDDNQNPGYPGQSGWPGNGLHYKAALVQADGNYDLEKRVNNGHEADFWAPGMTLGPGPAANVASDLSRYPNTDTYSGGVITSTGISISDFEETESGVWSFTVSGLEDPPQDFTPPTFPPVDNLGSGGGGGGSGGDADDDTDNASDDGDSSITLMVSLCVTLPLASVLVLFLSI